MIQVLAQFHSHNIVWRDCKPDNFLFLSSEAGSALKAIDFGTAVRCLPGDFLDAHAGERPRLACQGLGFSPPFIFSLGAQHAGTYQDYFSQNLEEAILDPLGNQLIMREPQPRYRTILYPALKLTTHIRTAKLLASPEPNRPCCSRPPHPIIHSVWRQMGNAVLSWLD